MSQGIHLRKYGVETTIDFEVYEVDGVDLRTDWTPAVADCEVMKDEGSSTQCSNTAIDEGETYSIVLTSTEMEAARLVLKVVDAATKVFLDKIVIIETYGNASAMHAFDLDTATQNVNTSTISAGAITAAAIANAAIDNATFAADVGSTVYATNIIALAVRKALDEIKLDHLIAVADGDDPVNNSIIAKLADSGATADWSAFVNTTDALRAIRDNVALASIATEARLAELDAGNIPTDLTNIEADTQDIQSRIPATLVSGRMSSDAVAISGDTTAADNLEAMHDGTGYIDDSAPASRDQIAALAGGVSISQVAESSTVTQGTEDPITDGYLKTQSHDGDYYTVTDDGGGAGIDFYLQFDIGEGNHPVEFHLHGYYDEGTGATNSLLLQAYNFNISDWQTIDTLTNANSDETHDISLTVSNVNGDNEVRIRFVQSAQEAGSDMLIDHATVGYVAGAVTAAEMADAVWDETSTGHIDAGKAGEQQWTDIDAILADTNEMQGKLPDNFIMGSSDQEDHDDEIDAIVANLGQVHTTEDESPSGGGGAPDTTSGIAEGC